MSQYLLIIIWIALVAFLAPSLNVQRQEIDAAHKPVWRYTPSFAFAVVFPLILMTTFRDLNIGDTGAYADGFRKLPGTLWGLLQHLPTVQKDVGYTVFAGLWRLVLGPHYRLFFFIVALIQIGILVFLYRRYSTDFFMSVFLFLASTDYISWLFNGIRQFMAVTLILLATPFILKKQWIPTVLLVVLASFFHQSALLMIPVILIIATGKAWNANTFFFLSLVVIAVAYVDVFTNILDAMMQSTQYDSMVSDWESWNDDGTNFLRVAVYSVPTILSFIGMRYIRAANDPVINLCTNMSIVSTGLYVVSMFTSGIFIGRLPIYASLYNYILLPWIIDEMFEEKSARLVKYGMVGLYLAFYYYQMHFSWGYV